MNFKSNLFPPFVAFTADLVFKENINFVMSRIKFIDLINFIFKSFIPHHRIRNKFCLTCTCEWSETTVYCYNFDSFPKYFISLFYEPYTQFLYTIYYSFLLKWIKFIAIKNISLHVNGNVFEKHFIFLNLILYV